MRAPLSWLHEYCRPELSAAALADRLDMTGTKVERVLRHGVGSPESFVVGRVLAAERHPDADRLTVCRVDVGDSEPAKIVCGAPNVAAGQTVAVARPGAIMPDGTSLGAAKLRGVVSEGMILAEDELGIGTDHGGILVLEDGGLAPGTRLAEALAIADEVLDLEITPNRPDCLGVYGVAREMHAATGAPLAPPPWSTDPGSAGELAGVAVAVDAGELCPRFTARLFEQVAIGPSPLWLKARLTAAGQRPINNVVDITNYVMLMTGQPLHAFDFDLVAGGSLVVRRAREGEEIETLDGVRRSLDDEVVVIEDADGLTSIAGIMGGARSEVSAETTRVLLEAATWDGPNIHRSSLALGLRSEASGRFEKQLAPEAAIDAQAVATGLIVELCGARVTPGTIDVGGPGPAPATIRLRDRTLTGLLGAGIPRERQRAILEALDFGVAEASDGLDVAVPAHRREDVTREVDVIEEVARLAGMENLPATLPAGAGGGRLTAEQRARRRVEDALCGLGLLETVGWSFQAAELADGLRLGEQDPRRHAVALSNPLSAEQAVMRTLLLGSLLDVARANVARDQLDLRLFETGAVHRAREEPGGLPEERRHVAVLLAGALGPPSWRSGERPRADFYAVKGVLGTLLDTLRLPWSVTPAGDAARVQPFLHPGRAGVVELAGEAVGWVGELHPLVGRRWDLEGASAFEIDLDRLAASAAAQAPLYEDLTSYPLVRQDLAVIVPEDIPAAQVRETVAGAGGELLSGVEVFDVYRGAQVGEGRVSLALALEFRASDRTLTDGEVAERREAIAAALRGLGGELRG